MEPIRSEYRHTFINRVNYSEQPTATVLVTTESCTLSDILRIFEDYLRGCGFLIDGHLDIVEDE